ncbi:hypothetical protein AX774_g4475 [Zancudomyces culisetae]|uniref:Conserved oligomeric Golgi complex subunit 7 n=1 Tax=Zancudomyces culisetae TaxID=1213189 RepID=A0A1R1PM62_ZANCU|nr:hypothetical protein AX774_g4475 [Zancudomyces culisetae]|eukprot:OMH82058.1 hypothetical protein AX774_g4475 [Zancudomyces culisetae]
MEIEIDNFDSETFDEKAWLNNVLQTYINDEQQTKVQASVNKGVKDGTSNRNQEVLVNEELERLLSKINFLNTEAQSNTDRFRFRLERTMAMLSKDVEEIKDKVGETQLSLLGLEPALVKAGVVDGDTEQMKGEGMGTSISSGNERENTREVVEKSKNDTTNNVISELGKIQLVHRRVKESVRTIKTSMELLKTPIVIEKLKDEGKVDEALEKLFSTAKMFRQLVAADVQSEKYDKTSEVGNTRNRSEELVPRFTENMSETTGKVDSVRGKQVDIWYGQLEKLEELKEEMMKESMVRLRVAITAKDYTEGRRWIRILERSDEPGKAKTQYIHIKYEELIKKWETAYSGASGSGENRFEGAAQKVDRNRVATIEYLEYLARIIEEEVESCGMLRFQMEHELNVVGEIFDKVTKRVGEDIKRDIEETEELQTVESDMSLLEYIGAVIKFYEGCVQFSDKMSERMDILANMNTGSSRNKNGMQLPYDAKLAKSVCENILGVFLPIQNKHIYYEERILITEKNKFRESIRKARQQISAVGSKGGHKNEKGSDSTGQFGKRSKGTHEGQIQEATMLLESKKTFQQVTSVLEHEAIAGILSKVEESKARIKRMSLGMNEIGFVSRISHSIESFIQEELKIYVNEVAERTKIPQLLKSTMVNNGGDITEQIISNSDHSHVYGESPKLAVLFESEYWWVLMDIVLTLMHIQIKLFQHSVETYIQALINTLVINIQHVYEIKIEQESGANGNTGNGMRRVLLEPKLFREMDVKYHTLYYKSNIFGSNNIDNRFLYEMQLKLLNKLLLAPANDSSNGEASANLNIGTDLDLGLGFDLDYLINNIRIDQFSLEKLVGNKNSGSDIELAALVVGTILSLLVESSNTLDHTSSSSYLFSLLSIRNGSTSKPDSTSGLNLSTMSTCQELLTSLLFSSQINDSLALMFSSYNTDDKNKSTNQNNNGRMTSIVNISNVVSQFSLSPSAAVRGIGEHLLTLPQTLEHLESTKVCGGGAVRSSELYNFQTKSFPFFSDFFVSVTKNSSEKSELDNNTYYNRNDNDGNYHCYYTSEILAKHMLAFPIIHTLHTHPESDHVGFIDLNLLDFSHSYSSKKYLDFIALVIMNTITSHFFKFRSSLSTDKQFHTDILYLNSIFATMNILLSDDFQSVISSFS